MREHIDKDYIKDALSHLDKNIIDKIELDVE